MERRVANGQPALRRTCAGSRSASPCLIYVATESRGSPSSATQRSWKGSRAETSLRTPTSTAAFSSICRMRHLGEPARCWRSWRCLRVLVVGGSVVGRRFRRGRAVQCWAGADWWSATWWSTTWSTTWCAAAARPAPRPGGQLYSCDGDHHEGDRDVSVEDPPSRRILRPAHPARSRYGPAWSDRGGQAYCSSANLGPDGGGGQRWGQREQHRAEPALHNAGGDEPAGVQVAQGSWDRSS